jgi:hypothetical protein
VTVKRNKVSLLEQGEYEVALPPPDDENYDDDNDDRNNNNCHDDQNAKKKRKKLPTPKESCTDDFG